MWGDGWEPVEGEHMSSRVTDSQSTSPADDARSRAIDPVIDLRSADAFVSIDIVDGSIPLLDAQDGLLGATHRQTRLKRAADLLIGGIAMLLVLPLLAIAALLIKLTSPGPVFHTQVRVGRDGRKFRLLKLRTMYVDAEERREALAAENESDGPVFKIRQDPRVTRVGRVLRKLSIDELPQLAHVLTGEMSLVGPRPPLPAEVETYSWCQLQRLLVKPGLTCTWQVSGRADLNFDTWVRMDIEYIHGWSPRSDLRLLAKTVPAVLSGRGAY
ncbi:MAG TPA: sugar transferase [Acidimicrobiia bacterium]